MTIIVEYDNHSVTTIVKYDNHSGVWQPKHSVDSYCFLQENKNFVSFLPIFSRSSYRCALSDKHLLQIYAWCPPNVGKYSYIRARLISIHLRPPMMHGPFQNVGSIYHLQAWYMKPVTVSYTAYCDTSMVRIDGRHGQEAGIARSLVEHRIHDWKVVSSNPGRSDGGIFCFRS